LVVSKTSLIFRLLKKQKIMKTTKLTPSAIKEKFWKDVKKLFADSDYSITSVFFDKEYVAYINDKEISVIGVCVNDNNYSDFRVIDKNYNEHSIDNGSVSFLPSDYDSVRGEILSDLEDDLKTNGFFHEQFCNLCDCMADAAQKFCNKSFTSEELQTAWINALNYLPNK